MKVLVLGSGGREHALAWRLRRDPGRQRRALRRPAIPAWPRSGRCLPVDLNDPAAMLALAERRAGRPDRRRPRGPARAGVADRVRAGRPRHRRAVAPGGRARVLQGLRQGSSWRAHGIPTARFRRLRRRSRPRSRPWRATIRLSGGRQGRRPGRGQGRDRRRRSRRSRGRRPRGDGRRPVRRAPARRLVIEECLTRSRGLVLRAVRRRPRAAARRPRRITSASGTTTAGRTRAAWARSRRVRSMTRGSRPSSCSAIVAPVLDGHAAEGAAVPRVPLRRA